MDFLSRTHYSDSVTVFRKNLGNLIKLNIVHNLKPFSM